MLTVPMLSAQGEVIGVIQLINKKPRFSRSHWAADGEVMAFDQRSEELALAWVAMAGIALENAMLYEEIRTLFEGFVDASVIAIEQRDPTTSGHSRRVATMSVALAEDAWTALGSGPFADVRFSRDADPADRVRGRAARFRQGRRPREGAGQGEEALRRGPARADPPALRLHQEGARGRARASAS